MAIRCSRTNGNGTVAQYDINSSSGALTAEATVATGTSGPMFLAFVRD